MNEENEEESQDWGHISTIIWANLSTENIVVEFHKQDSLTIDKVLSEERYDSYRLAPSTETIKITWRNAETGEVNSKYVVFQY